MYIDPGLGSLVIQMLIAGIMGGLFLFRASWGRVRTFLRKILWRK